MLESMKHKIKSGIKYDDIDLRKIRSRLTFLGYSAQPVYNVFFAMEEVLKNIKLYSRDESDINVVVNIYENLIRINIKNTGVEFDPLYMRNPDIKMPEKVREMAALGIQVIRNISRDAKYIRFKGSNITSVSIAVKMSAMALELIKNSKRSDSDNDLEIADERYTQGY